ncbi:MAG TPA: YfhO family protein, partial [Anaerolineales bacterium]|nr:YfhO family protein [Anaerolineales bacterium]
WLWAAFVVGGWILALGDTTPVGGALARLPGWNLLRVPPRWLFVSALGLSVLCADGAEAILDSARGEALRRSTRIAAAVIMGAAVAFAAALTLVGSPSALPASAVILTPALAVAAFAVVSLSQRLTNRAAGMLVAVLVLADLFAIDHSLIETRDLMAQEQVASGPWFWTEDIGAGHRLFSPSYAVPQDAAAQRGLELADGVHPLQLRAYVDWMAEATGFERADYSVTLPPFPTGGPKEDWGPRLDAGLLGKLSVEFVLSDYPLDAPGWQAAGSYAGVFAYANPEVRPRAWLEDGDRGWTPATIVERTPNRIRLRAPGPGRLVLSEVAYPGWKVQIDGKPASILTVDGLLRGVDLGAGEHNVTFAFRPATVYAGLTLTLMTLVAIAWLWGRRP